MTKRTPPPTPLPSRRRKRGKIIPTSESARKRSATAKKGWKTRREKSAREDT